MAIDARPAQDRRPTSIVAPLRDTRAAISEDQRIHLERLVNAVIHPNMPRGLREQVVAAGMAQLTALGPEAIKSLSDFSIANTGLIERATQAGVQGRGLMAENGHEARTTLMRMIQSTNFHDGRRQHLVNAFIGMFGRGWPGMGEREAAAQRRRFLAAQDEAERRRRVYLGEEGGDGDTPAGRAAKAAAARAKSAGPSARGPRPSSLAYRGAGMDRPPHERPELPEGPPRADLAAGRAAERSVPVPTAPADGVVAPVAAAPDAPVVPPRRLAALHAPSPAG